MLATLASKSAWEISRPCSLNPWRMSFCARAYYCNFRYSLASSSFSSFWAYLSEKDKCFFFGIRNVSLNSSSAIFSYNFSWLIPFKFLEIELTFSIMLCLYCSIFKAFFYLNFCFPRKPISSGSSAFSTSFCSVKISESFWGGRVEVLLISSIWSVLNKGWASYAASLSSASSLADLSRAMVIFSFMAAILSSSWSLCYRSRISVSRSFAFWIDLYLDSCSLSSIILSSAVYAKATWSNRPWVKPCSSSWTPALSLKWCGWCFLYLLWWWCSVASAMAKRYKIVDNLVTIINLL